MAVIASGSNAGAVALDVHGTSKAGAARRGAGAGAGAGAGGAAVADGGLSDNPRVRRMVPSRSALLRIS